MDNTESISFYHPDKVMLGYQIGGFICNLLTEYNRIMEFGNFRANSADVAAIDTLIDEFSAHLIRIMEGKEGF